MATKKPMKVYRLESMLSDFMDEASELFPKDEDAEKVVEQMELSDADRKWLAKADLDSLSKLLIASILGYS